MDDADFRFGEIANGDVTIRYAAAGDPAAPLLLMLHGFPEYWAAWAKVMTRLADRFHVVAPDQRGYNLSSKPQGVEAYRARYLAADVAALAEVPVGVPRPIERESLCDDRLEAPGFKVGE